MKNISNNKLFWLGIYIGALISVIGNIFVVYLFRFSDNPTLINSLTHLIALEMFFIALTLIFKQINK